MTEFKDFYDTLIENLNSFEGDYASFLLSRSEIWSVKRNV